MQKINWKQTIVEIIYISAFVLVMAIIYNTLNPHGINLMRKPNFASDTLLERLLIDTAKPKISTTHDTLRSFVRPDTVNHIDEENKAVERRNFVAIDPRNQEASSTHNFDEIPIVTYNQLVKFLNSPNLILIDARTPHDFEKAHIGNAVNIFAYEENLDIYFQKLSSIPFDERKVIIVYCDGGSCDASHKVAKDLIQLGHKNVFVFTGGWEEWIKKSKEINE